VETGQSRSDTKYLCHSGGKMQQYDKTVCAVGVKKGMKRHNFEYTECNTQRRRM